MSDKPVVYLLHGEDTFAIQRFIQTLEERLGDPATAQMNLTVIEKGAFSFRTLASAAQAMPFLSPRRLVVVHDPLAALNSPAQREKFIALLEGLPETTALVIAIARSLIQEGKKTHWLLAWAAAQGGRVYIRELTLPRGAQLARWVRDQCAEMGGAITPQAVDALIELAGPAPRLLRQELEKLLAYVNYARPIDADDVAYLISGHAEGNIFALVDAVGNQNRSQALKLLHTLLDEEAPLRIFSMLARQFRLLIMARELLDQGFTVDEIAKSARIRPFVVRKLIPQANRYTLAMLEQIYARLLDIDVAIKGGQVDADVALDTLIAALTA